MKKLNITKKQYDESKYFNKKYGALKYMSESGKLYKTDKGVVLALEGQECKNGDCQENESLDDIANAVKKTGGEMVDKVKDGAKKVGKAIGDKMHGIYRKNDRVKISGKAGDMEGAVVSADPNKVVIKPDNERSFDESDDADSEEVTRGELTDMLKDVVDAVEKVCDAQDCSFEEVIGVEPKDEAEEADADEVVATKEEVAEVLADVIDRVEDVAEKAGIELPNEDDKEIEDECNATECGDKKVTLESLKKARRARLVREAIARRARAKKIHESILRNARLRKIRESIARRARAKKVQESIAKRRAMRRAR